MTPIEVLQKKFGYSSFRLEQQSIIQSVLQRRDTFVLMPTGGGKSLCYQVPSLIFDGLTIVISPLIALMKDQVDSLRVNGIEAAYLNSTQSYAEQNEVMARAKENKLKLLYLAPERLIRFDDRDGIRNSSISPMMTALLDFKISLIAIDEAHCISQWGHDFRPEYLMLATLKKALPEVPVIALTATADKLTRGDIVDKLALNDPATFISSFNRANIRYTVESKRDAFDKLVSFLSTRNDESGIIYCLSRASTEKLAEDLTELGFDALPYHAGLERAQRDANQEKFLRDEVRIIVATIAFGMGINKSNVRYVVHMDLPKNLEGYYQETGRAGRDGLESEALLFFSFGDVNKLKRFARVDGNEDQTQIAFRKLDQMAEYATINRCRRKYLLEYFDEKANAKCGNCDVCLSTVELYDGTPDAQKMLAAVSKLEERFGVGYVIDFLRGSGSSKIKPEHRKLGSFASGSHLSKAEWNDIIRELIQQHYLVRTRGMYPQLMLTSKSQEVLDGKAQVKLMKSKTISEAAGRDNGGYEKDLFDALKERRFRIAEDDDVPPYVVLSDASLREMATYLPMNKNDLRKISGFGEVKIERYGNRFWEVIADYCAEHGLSTRIHLKAEKARRERSERDSETKRQTLELFKDGYEIERIAVVRDLAVSTIETHLAYYVEHGKIGLDQLMDHEDIQRIKRAIQRSDTDMVSVIRQSLNDEYSYGQIRLVIADLHRMKEMVRL
jgi:ATP-dependent DNA helicase RecQ